MKYKKSIIYTDRWTWRGKPLPAITKSAAAARTKYTCHYANYATIVRLDKPLRFYMPKELVHILDIVMKDYVVDLRREWKEPDYHNYVVENGGTLRAFNDEQRRYHYCMRNTAKRKERAIASSLYRLWYRLIDLCGDDADLSNIDIDVTNTSIDVSGFVSGSLGKVRIYSRCTIWCGSKNLALYIDDKL